MTKFLNKKLLVILGPTASGKSDLAIKLAKEFNGEVVSADSRQVYKGMDFGSGKIPKDKNSKFCPYGTSPEGRQLLFLRDISRRETTSKFYYSNGIRHHLLDVADPKEYFSVAQYQKLAIKAIKDIQKRRKLPILCGGTGLYLSAVIEGWQFPKVPPNAAVRRKMEKLSLENLLRKLQKLDPKKAENIDPKNQRRLIRALEIALQKGKVAALKKIPPKWNILIIGIQKNKEDLRKLILKRLEKRLKEGMTEEVIKLKEGGVPSKRLEDFGLEYRWLNRYLENKTTLPKMKEELYRASWRYAKRQMTWFKNKIKNIKLARNLSETKKLITDFYNIASK